MYRIVWITDTRETRLGRITESTSFIRKVNKRAQSHFKDCHELLDHVRSPRTVPWNYQYQSPRRNPESSVRWEMTIIAWNVHYGCDVGWLRRITLDDLRQAWWIFVVNNRYHHNQSECSVSQPIASSSTRISRTKEKHLPPTNLLWWSLWSVSNVLSNRCSKHWVLARTAYHVHEAYPPRWSHRNRRRSYDPNNRKKTYTCNNVRCIQRDVLNTWWTIVIDVFLLEQEKDAIWNRGKMTFACLLGSAISSCPMPVHWWAFWPSLVRWRQQSNVTKNIAYELHCHRQTRNDGTEVYSRT